jgi:hypothetical protein
MGQINSLIACFNVLKKTKFGFFLMSVALVTLHMSFNRRIALLFGDLLLRLPLSFAAQDELWFYL